MKSLTVCLLELNTKTDIRQQISILKRTEANTSERFQSLISLIMLPEDGQGFRKAFVSIRKESPLLWCVAALLGHPAGSCAKFGPWLLISAIIIKTILNRKLLATLSAWLITQISKSAKNASKASSTSWFEIGWIKTNTWCSNWW